MSRDDVPPASAWAPTIRVRIEQFAPVLGDRAINLDRVAAAQADGAADGVNLLVTPELALTGYDLRDRTDAVALPLAGGHAWDRLADGPDLVVGFVEAGDDFVVYNSAVHLRDGRPLHRHRKVYLPTYGMFDEGRYFGRGDCARVYDAGGGWRVGLLVCEDLWHPALAYLLAVGGVNLVVVQAAAAGRGGWVADGEPAAGPRFASWAGWEPLARAAATAYGVYVVLANRVGVEGSCVFAGGSLVVGPDGAVVARAPALDEAKLTATLELERVARARRPFAHARDEDVHLVRRELDRLLREPA